MKKTIIYAILAFCLTSVTAYAFTEPISFGGAAYESDGITVNYICRGISSIEDGNPIIVTAVAGNSETIIQIVDINAEKLLRTFHTGISGTMWYGCADSDGNVYCCVGRNLLVYSPDDKTIVNAGYVPTTWSGASNGIAAAEDNTVYGVTSAYGYVYSYKKGEAITNLCRLPEVYSMGGVAVIGEYVYAGGTYSGSGEASTYVYKINRTTGQVSAVSNPLTENIASVGHIYACGDYIIAQLGGYSGTKHAYFYNTKTDTWLSKTIDFNENGMSDLCGGKLFYLSGGVYCGIDTQTLEITRYPAMKGGNYHRGNGLAVTCDGFSGECFINVQYNGNLYVASPEDGVIKRLDVQLEEAKAERRITRVGTDGRVYISAFMGSEGVAYNPATGEKNSFFIGQGEGAVCYNGKMYMGVYPGAEIYEIDMSKTAPTSEKIFDIENEQDRPFGMDVADGALVVGTLPVTGENGGALTVIDLDTHNGTTYRNIIDGHSILTVTHKDNIVYCGTTVCGGSGSMPADGAAHVFSFNIETGELVKDAELRIPGVDADIAAVHGLKISPYDGLLYGAAAGVDFVMNPYTLEIVRYNIYSEDFEVAEGTAFQSWHEYYMEFYEGYLFRTNDIINPETLEIVDSVMQDCQFAGIFDDKAYFVASNTDIYSVPIIRNFILGKTWNFDDAADMPEGFAVNNKNIYRYHTQGGPSGESGDIGFGWVIGIGNGRGEGVITKYSNGFNILAEEIGSEYINNTSVAVDMDFMIKNDCLTAYLICPRFGASMALSNAVVSLDNGVIYAGEKQIGACSKDEWHNIAAVYSFSETGGVIYNVYYDEMLVAEGITVDNEVTRLGASCFSILINADTSDEAYAESTRYDVRGEILYIDNLYIGKNLDNIGSDITYKRRGDIIDVNGGAYGGEAALIAAEYSDGALTAVEKEDIKLDARRTHRFYTAEGRKTFLWSSMAEMKPVPDGNER